MIISDIKVEIDKISCIECSDKTWLAQDIKNGVEVGKIRSYQSESNLDNAIKLSNKRAANNS